MEAQIAEQALALRARDGIALAVRKWNAPDLPVRAVMVVAHGMGEHSGRYRGPLGPVIASGVQTYALDHRGQGGARPFHQWRIGVGMARHRYGPPSVRPAVGTRRAVCAPGIRARRLRAN